MSKRAAAYGGPIIGPGAGRKRGDVTGRRLCISLDWQGSGDRETALERIGVADAAGVDTAFVAEAWGRDAFTMLTLAADGTSRIKLGTGIVNYYSRSPAALAQHFATLDELSEGRMIIGLGASSANVIEHFHGIPFNPTLARMRETVSIINMLIAGRPLNFRGRWFDLQRGFTLRFKPYRDHIPVYIASFRPRAVKVVAEVADGWMPTRMPVHHLKEMVERFHGYVRAAGRDPSDLTVVSPGSVVVTRDRAKAIETAKANTAFYVARMGDYYYQQLSETGFAEECDAIRRAWNEGGPTAGYAAVPDEMQLSLGAYGSIEECRDRLIEQEAAGVSLHTVVIEGADSAVDEGRIYEQLMR